MCQEEEKREQLLIDIEKCIYKEELKQIMHELMKIKDIIKYDRYEHEGLIYQWQNKSQGNIWSLGLYHICGLDSQKENFEDRYEEVQNQIKNNSYLEENTIEVKPKNEITKNFEEFDSILEIVKKIPYCFQCFINFIEPNTIVDKHTDTNIVSMFADVEGVENFGSKLYQCVFAIKIPSKKPELCAFDIGGIIHPTKDGEITIFDGSVEHRGWNFTDDWRITMVIDLDRKAFNL
jgi:hypothetical protein